MGDGEGKSSGVEAAATGEPVAPQSYYYGTFQGVANYHQPIPPPPPPPPPPSQPAIGFPQPIPPPGSSVAPPHYYHHGYQAIPVYAVAEGRPLREPQLPCCGMGIGWFLFVTGFLLGAIPWYIGAFLLLCVRWITEKNQD